MESSSKHLAEEYKPISKKKMKINTHGLHRRLFMYSPKLIDFYMVLDESKLSP
jgi:hypothetical protein